MLRIRATVICDGCGREFSAELYDTSDAAREAAWAEKWATQRVYNRLLDFCAECQVAPVEEVAKSRVASFR